jgi:hypothetical protein
MKIIITENQFNNIWFKRRIDLIRKLVDKYLVSMGEPTIVSRFYYRDDYFDEVVRRVISDLTDRQDLTLGQKVYVTDLIRKNFGNRIDYYRNYQELY